ncbi:MAG: Uma2 family endonuclease [Candidatus Latescibacterota bacterium]
MPLPQPYDSSYTYKDYSEWEGRWEIIHGVAYAMTPAPNTKHQRTVGSVFRLIGDLIDESKLKSGHGDCEVFVSPIDVILGEDTVVQPDALVVCDPAKISERGIEGPPDLVVEVLSPSTAMKDLNSKRWLYESSGVPEYLVLDPENRIAELFVLDSDGRYHTGARVPWKESIGLLGGRLSLTLD